MIATQQTESSARSRGQPEPLRIPTEQLDSPLKWLIKSPEVPPPVANAACAWFWLLKVGAFRDKEDELIGENKFDENIADHRVALSGIIAEGEFIISMIKKTGLAETTPNFTPQDIEATLASLQITLRCQHRSDIPPDTGRLLDSMLGTDANEPVSRSDS